ncbi:hypothetical protein [Flammeovirga sp. EKP202]|uniref:hypothetical protein n=1 Tax=Flammeovirga sp. EKP202 TaxID=2770592 RepID=UPI00165F0AEF|nr:hypothetical protein [Flammeovirga sp. EKP202]MBD0401442.1 hypothetical protein [Flammeovirga sp. EKP202]
MKNKYTYLFSAFALMILGVLTQCKDPLEGFAIAVNTSVFNHEANIQLFDPQDQTRLEGNQVLNIEILGKDASKVVNNAGDKKFAAQDGVVSIALKDQNLTEPAEFVVKVSGEDYLTTTIPVTIDPEDSLVDLSSFLVNMSNPPEGVQTVSEKTSLSQGKLTTSFTVETPTTEPSCTNVTIPAETSFMDADGNTLTGGQLEVQVANFDSRTSDAIESFPGGFAPTEVVDENGETQDDISFITAGFASIDMYVGNKEVKEFSAPVEITMQVNSDYVNPITGEGLKVGDKIPVWSYSNDDGTWEYHTEGTVSQGENGLEVIYETTHLSWYNLDFYGTRCRTGSSTVTVNLPGVTADDGYRLYSDIVYAGTSQPITSWSGKTTTWYDGKTFNYYNAPSNVNVQVVVYSGTSRYRKGELLYTSEPFNLCSGAEVSIPASQFISQIPKLENVTIDYTGYCGDNIVEPSTYLYMYDPNYGYWRYVGYVYKGSITIYGVELNRPYKFRVYYNNRAYEHELTLTSTYMVDDSYEIPDTFCNRFF